MEKQKIKDELDEFRGILSKKKSFIKTKRAKISDLKEEHKKLQSKLKQCEAKLKNLESQIRTEMIEIEGLERTIANREEKLDSKSKRKAIPKAIRTLVWNKFFTDDAAKGNCQVCQKEIRVTDFECAHLVSVANGGTDSLHNLMPTCSLCNKSMGTQNYVEFRLTYFKNPSIQHHRDDKKKIKFSQKSVLDT